MRNPLKYFRSYWKSLDRSAKLRLAIFPILTIFGVFFTVFGLILTPDWGAFLLNLGTGLLGAMMITFFIDEFIGHSEKAEQRAIETEEVRLKLIIDLRSGNRDVVQRALEEIRQRGWLENGSLKWSNLSGSNFEGLSLVAAKLNNVRLRNVNFSRSNLQLADFEDSILSECSLVDVDLNDANLREADLNHSDLSRADLTGANLTGAYLAEAILIGADLQDSVLALADLTKSNLHNARNLQTLQLLQANCLRAAVMPDGTIYDGRYELKGDIAAASREGIDIFNAEDMSRFYGASQQAYQRGEVWRQRNLKKISEYLKVEEESVESVEIGDKQRWEVKKLSKKNLWVLTFKNKARIDSATDSKFADSLLKINESGGHKIVVNLRETEYLSSAGFRVLLHAQRAAKRYNRGEVVLCAVPGRIREALELAGFTELFKTFDNLDEAIQALGKEDDG